MSDASDTPPAPSGGPGGAEESGPVPADRPAAQGTRRPRAAISAAFGLQGFTLSMLLTLLPEFQDDFDLSEGTISAVVVLASVIAGAGSLIAEALANRTDSRISLRGGLAVIVVAVVCVAFAPGVPAFFGCFAVYGVGLGMVDASTNMQGVALQQRKGTSIMTSFHASWSVGAIIGALWVSAFSGMDLSLGTTLLAGIAFVAVGALTLSPLLLRVFPSPANGPSAGAGERPAIPRLPFLALGLAMALFYAIDFGIDSGSSLFMTNALAADTSVAALAMTGYQIASLLCRGTGDLWVRRFGDVIVVRVGAAIAIVGLLLVVTAQSIPMGIAGFAVVGLGAPVVAPLCFAAAGRLAPKGQADTVIARVNLFNYVGTIIGGGVVTGFAGITDWRYALMIPLVFAIGLALLAPAFHPRTSYYED